MIEKLNFLMYFAQSYNKLKEVTYHIITLSFFIDFECINEL